MNENINLCELLKGHESEKFYSPIYGEVIIKFDEQKTLEIWPVTERGYLPLAPNGHLNYNQNDGECLIFPSRDQRDWNKWAKEQKSKTPKIFDEITLSERDYFIRNLPDFVLSKTQKSALALLKIHQLIEFGYGGNVTDEEWKDNSVEKFIIVPSENGFKVDHRFKIRAFRHIAFHTRQQAEQFLSYKENKDLLKDYFML